MSSEIESVQDALRVAEGVKDLAEQEESTVAEVKVGISNAVGYMQQIGKYFEGFAGLLVKNGMSASKQSKAGQDAIEIAKKLAATTKQLEELGTKFKGIADEAVDLMSAMQDIVSSAE